MRFVLFMLLNYVFTFFVLYCDIRYDFRVMFDSSWLLFVGVCVLFTYTGVEHDFYIRWCSVPLTVTLRVSHVEQKLLILPKHLSSSPNFSAVRIARSLVFCVNFCRSLSVLFLLTIVFDVISRLTASDYSFAIFKLFWHTWYIYLIFP